MRLYVRTILVVAACGTLPAEAEDGPFQDHIELEDGTRLSGDLVELGGAHLEVRIKGGSKTILRREIVSTVLDGQRPARGVASSDVVLRLADGRTITGKVEILAGGQRVRITKPGGSSVMYPRKAVKIIRKGDPLGQTRRVYTRELAADIAESLTILRGLKSADLTADTSRVAKEEAFLIECGIFAIEDVRRLLAEDEVAREGDGAGTLVSPARVALRAVDRVYRLKCVIAPEIEAYDSNVYKILAYADRQGKVDLLFFVFYRFAQEAVPLASFLAREDGEDQVVRAYAVDVLRRLQENRVLVEIYRDSTGKTQLACAIALGKNHVLFGVPALIEALEMSDERIREVAVTHLREFSGERFRFRPSGAPEARRLAVLRWRGWWSEKQDELEALSRRILERGNVETPQQRRALALWKEAALSKEVRVAESYLRQTLKIDPLFFRARIGLAILELSENERPRAALKELLEIKAETRPDLTVADRFWVNLYIGHAKRLMGDNTGALEAYRHAASYDIENVEGTESLGEMAYVVATTEPKIDSAERKATLELALDAFTRALTQIAAYEDSLVTFTINDMPIEPHLRFDRRRHNRDVLGFRKRFRVDAFRYVLSLARIESLLGRKPEAVARLEKSLKDLAPLASVDALHSAEVQMRNLLGILYEESGQRAQALRQYKFVLEYLDKKDEESHLGIRRLRAGRVAN